MKIITFFNDMLLAPVMFGVLLLCALVLSIRLRGFPLRNPVVTVRNLFCGNIRSSFKAMTLALSGTLGVGNIVGVATAIHMGGAGAVFWMLVSALAAMVIKYAEIYLAVLYRREGSEGYHGGAAYYIREGLGQRGLAIVFSLLFIGASFTVGNMIQVNAVAQSAEGKLGVSGVWAGVVLSVLTVLVIGKGFTGITNVTVRLIPVLSIGYTLMSLVVIIANGDMIVPVLKDIFCSAFTPDSARGGFIGFVLMKSLRYGVVRGIGSNEAGCGTAPTAHATADTDSPGRQGCWGVFEVFVDTVLLCTLTALVILMYPRHIPDNDGMLLAIRAYESYFGAAAGYLLFCAIFFFALSTVICWGYYGMEALGYISKSRILRRGYIFIYALFCVIGSVVSLSGVWELSDLTISLMTVINCVCIILLRDKISCPVEKHSRD